ncbi:MAG: flagellar motor protein MotB, partial [Pseudomonadota bacterium]
MAMSANRPIIIKRVKKVAGGHHGGAWKVAYADFVTAMMAFFLLMWLINTTSPEQKRGIADYFAPASLSASTSGSGGILGGTALGETGALQ